MQPIVPNITSKVTKWWRSAYLQAAFVKVKKTVEPGFEKPVKTPVSGLVLGFEQARAHHRRQRQRDDQGQDQRHADGHREFPKQQADIAAHQEQRDEDGNQRQRDRDDRKPDLAGALDGRLHRAQPLLQMAVHVFDDDDGVVDDEPDRDRQRHQRQVVEAVAELVEHGEGADQ